MAKINSLRDSPLLSISQPVDFVFAYTLMTNYILHFACNLNKSLFTMPQALLLQKNMGATSSSIPSLDFFINQIQICFELWKILLQCLCVCIYIMQICFFFVATYFQKLFQTYHKYHKKYWSSNIFYEILFQNKFIFISY